MDPKAISDQINKSWILRNCYSRNPYGSWLYALPLSALFFGLGFHGSGQLGLSLGLFGAGILYWTLFEYLIHRFFFHWVPESPKLHALVYRIHEHHHDLPNDYTILNAGPFFGIPMAILSWLLTSLVLASLSHSASLVSGALVGYMFYEWVHFEAHAGNHKKGWMGYLKRYHLTHHHLTRGACYGVTSPFWDKIFRTELKSARKSETLVS